MYATTYAKARNNKIYKYFTTTKLYDFNFLAPCPSSGLIVQGKKDDLVPIEETANLQKNFNLKKYKYRI